MELTQAQLDHFDRDGFFFSPAPSLSRKWPCSTRRSYACTPSVGRRMFARKAAIRCVPVSRCRCTTSPSPNLPGIRAFNPAGYIAQRDFTPIECLSDDCLLNDYDVPLPWKDGTPAEQLSGLREAA